MQLILAGDRVLSVAVLAGDHIVGGGQRPHELAAHIGVLGGQLGCSLLVFLHQVFFFFDHVGIGLVHRCLLIFGLFLGGDFGLPLGLQLGHVGVHHRFSGLGVGLCLLQLGLFLGHLVPDGLQLFKELFIPDGDLLNDLPPVEKVGKAVGGQQNGQIAVVAVLGHIPDAFFHPGVLVGLLLFTVSQLDGFFLNMQPQLCQQFFLGSDFILLGLNLTVQQGNLLFQRGNITGNGGKLVFQLFFLAGGLVDLVFQRIHLTFGDGKNGQCRQQHAADHQGSQQNGNGRNDLAVAVHFALICSLFLFHKLTPSGNDEW